MHDLEADRRGFAARAPQASAAAGQGDAAGSTRTANQGRLRQADRVVVWE